MNRTTNVPEQTIPFPVEPGDYITVDGATFELQAYSANTNLVRLIYNGHMMNVGLAKFQRDLDSADTITVQK